LNTLPANFPEVMLLLALLCTVIAWRVIALILTVLAVGFVLLVVAGMAGYGVVTMLSY
jgi:hypothetical protein